MDQYLFGYDCSEGSDVACLCIGIRTDDHITISKIFTGEQATILADQLGPDPFISKETYEQLLNHKFDKEEKQ